jgi:hypothetical protein
MTTKIKRQNCICLGTSIYFFVSKNDHIKSEVIYGADERAGSLSARLLGLLTGWKMCDRCAALSACMFFHFKHF